MKRRSACGLFGALALSAPHSQGAAALGFIAATNHSAPLSVWSEGRLQGGLILELSELLADELRRRPLYLSRPAKRAPDALRAGEGDLLCYTRPGWIGSDFHFTEALVPNAEVVAATAGAPPLRELAQLRGQRVGTVLGYHYGDVIARAGFQREDAPDMGANLRKLAQGRVRYALTDALSLSGAQRARPAAGLSQALLIERFEASCALSLRSALPAAELDAAVRALKRDGRLQALLDRYR